jgi:hypothetical protein
VLSLDDRLPKNLRPDVKDLQQQFKKKSCPVHWNQTGPVKRGARKRKNGRVPGWEVGKGKKTVFVGYQDRRCDFSVLRTPMRAAFNDDRERYLRARKVPAKYSQPMNRATTVSAVGVGGILLGGTLAGTFYDYGGTLGETASIVGTSMAVTGLVMAVQSYRSYHKQAAIAHLKKRKAKGLKKRKTAKSLVARCFDEKLKRQGRVSAATMQSAQKSCEQLTQLLKPGKWEYGKLNGVSPAELAVRAANQNRALNRNVRVWTTKDVMGLENEMFAALKRHDLKRASDLAAKLNKKASSIAASRRGKPSASNCKLLKSESARFFDSGNYGGLDATDYERLKPLISYIGRKEVCGGNAVAYTKKEVDGMDQIVRTAERVRSKIAEEKRIRKLAGVYTCQGADNSFWSLTLGSNGNFKSGNSSYWSSGTWVSSPYDITLFFEASSEYSLIGRSSSWEIQGRKLVGDQTFLGRAVCR